MKKARFSEEQIVRILKEVDAGAKVTETCRKHELPKTSTSVEVLPGPHKVVATCTNTGNVLEQYSVNKQTHDVQAEAGKSYVLQARRLHPGCETRIVEDYH